MCSFTGKKNRTFIPNTEIYNTQIKIPMKLQKFFLQKTPKNKQLKKLPNSRAK